MVLLLFAGYLAYCVLNRGMEHFEDADTKRVAERQKILADRHQEDDKLLHDAPGWFNKDKGFVRVPIEQAMAMTVAELGRNKPHAAYPIVAATPAPAPSPSPAAKP